MKLIKMSIDPGTTIQLRQWVTCIKEVEKRNGTDSETATDVDDNTIPLVSQNKTYKKLQCQLKEGCTGEVLQQLINEWNVILTHINTKRIQAQEF